MTQVTLEGRIVAGHPMTRRAVTKQDPLTRQDVPVTAPDGTPATEVYCAVAVPKHPGVDWRQEPWGQVILGQAVKDWPNGEYQRTDFAWKMADGDSTIPNKRGKKPCDREGWAGHWVIHTVTRFQIKCYHAGKYDPMQQIQDANEIKCGDYGRLVVDVVGNGPSQSPGLYMNPQLFSLDRAGALIQSDSGPSAAEAFGGPVPAAAAVVVTPAHDIVAGPGLAPPPPPPPVPVVERFSYQGNTYTRDQLVGFGWNADQINSLPKV